MSSWPSLHSQLCAGWPLRHTHIFSFLLRVFWPGGRGSWCRSTLFICGRSGRTWRCEGIHTMVSSWRTGTGSWGREAGFCPGVFTSESCSQKVPAGWRPRCPQPWPSRKERFCRLSPLFCSLLPSSPQRASLVAQLVKNPPAMREAWVQPLGWEDPLEKGTLPTPVFWPGELHGLYSPWGHRESTRLSEFHVFFFFFTGSFSLFSIPVARNHIPR